MARSAECCFASIGLCLTTVLAGYLPRKASPVQLLEGRIGRGTNPPPQLGKTLRKTPLTQPAQKVHSNEQILASSEFGGRALPQFSQVGRSSSTFQSLFWIHGQYAEGLGSRAQLDDSRQQRQPCCADWIDSAGLSCSGTASTIGDAPGSRRAARRAETVQRPLQLLVRRDLAQHPYRRTSGVMPVCFAMRASLRGPISSPASNAKTTFCQPSRAKLR